MKAFRTPIEGDVSKHTLGFRDKIFTIGSCFADVVGAKLILHKLHAYNNPFGTLYNPCSIHKAVRYALLQEEAPEHTFVNSQGIYFNYDFHSELSSPDKPELTQKIQDATQQAHFFLKEAATIIITYGTAWVYERIDTGEIVANCHKVPARHFNKRLLTVDETVASFRELYSALKSFNPGLRFVLTVSPVRHLKDTAAGNMVSKSVLRVACHTITEICKDVDYFPAYEVMMDELRDYRFYKADMIHPTDEAADYIWEKFSSTYFDQATQTFMVKWQKILAAIAHKPFHPQSAAHQLFLKETLEKLYELKEFVNVEEEESMIKARLLQSSST